MRRLMEWLSRQEAIALLLVRLATGAVLVDAGYRKLFLAGLAGVTSQFREWGYPLPQVIGPAIGLFELVGGLALFAGLFSRYIGVLVTIQFVVAILTVNMARGFQPSRLPMMLVVAGLVIATSGGGAWTLDRLLSRGRW
ncbi:MAG: DoxX family protein [Candidatus Lambdaproteobacteria bacterium]|nr:DoxX family protein [Candidatus Lambdaproteobacteria bacterium]